MYNIELPKTITQICAVFYGLGLWSIRDGTTFRENRQKIFQFTYFVSFLISIVVGAIVSNDKDELIFLTVLSIGVSVHALRLFYIIWRKNEILSLIGQCSNYSINKQKDFIRVNKKIILFFKFVNFFIFMLIIAFFLISIFPIFSSGKLLIVNIAFPLDRKHSQIEFWITHVYVVIGCTYCILCTLLSIIIWYLMINCAIKYEILETEFRKIGVQNLKTTKITGEQLFLKDLKIAIKSHQETYE